MNWDWQKEALSTSCRVANPYHLPLPLKKYNRNDISRIQYYKVLCDNYGVYRKLNSIRGTQSQYTFDIKSILLQNE